MPCTVKCECGKTSKLFHKLNADQIPSFKCADCREVASEDPKAGEETDSPKAKPAKAKKAPKAAEPQ